MSKFLYENIEHYSCTQCLEAYSSLSEFIDHQLENPDCESHEPKIVMNEQFERSLLNDSRKEVGEEDDDEFSQYGFSFERECNPSNVLPLLSDCEVAKTQHTCKYCPFTCETSVQLQYHAKITHYKSKCETCGKLFLDENQLNTHRQRIHSEGGQLHCKICDKTINGNLATLRQHELGCNARCSSEKDKDCQGFWDELDSAKKKKSAASTKNLQASKTKQTKPYIAYCRIKNCDVVYKSTNLVQGVVARRRQHEALHGVDDEYECHYCKACYRAYTDYLNHVKRCSIKFGAPKRPCQVKPVGGFYHIFI